MSQALLDHASRTIAAGSSSFAVAARLFPAPTRRSVVMLYAWCRHCDDVIDGQQLGVSTALPTAPAAARQLAWLARQTRRAYAGKTMDEPAFAAFQEVVLQHAIAPQFAFDHLAGFAMDVQQARYETIADTLRYCYHVAGVVGLMMATILGVKQAAVLDRACDLGLAFQLTNIARDQVEDAAAGRCYVPAQWLREAGMTAHELAQPQHRAALATIAARLIEHAEPYYVSAGAGIAALPLRSAWAIATAHRVYRQIGIEVKARGVHAWDRRVTTSRTTKLRLLVQGGIAALVSRIERRKPEWTLPGFRSDPVRPAGLWQRPGPDAGAAVHAEPASDA